MDQTNETQVPLPSLEKIVELRQELSMLIQEMVTAHSIEEKEAKVLLLRLGIIGGTCATLKKTGQILNTSPEWVRQRQFFLMKRKIKNTRFFSKLHEYGTFVHLPKGFLFEDTK